MNPFITLYECLFEVKVAKSQKEIQAVHRLRYEVYVLERQWEPTNADALECDQFDPRAIHLLLTHKPTQTPIGTARIILPNPQNLHHSYPAQTVCHHPIFLDRHWVTQHPEFSRFAIPKQRRDIFLSHPSFQQLLTAMGLSEKTARFSMAMGLSFGLICKMAQVLREEGFEGTCAVLEKSLLRLLKKNGLRIHEIGHEVEHHGLRQPCYMNVTHYDDLVSHHETMLSEMLGQAMSAQSEAHKNMNIL